MALTPTRGFQGELDEPWRGPQRLLLDAEPMRHLPAASFPAAQPTMNHLRALRQRAAEQPEAMLRPGEGDTSLLRW